MYNIFIVYSLYFWFYQLYAVESCWPSDASTCNAVACSTVQFALSGAPVSQGGRAPFKMGVNMKGRYWTWWNRFLNGLLSMVFSLELCWRPSWSVDLSICITHLTSIFRVLMGQLLQFAVCQDLLWSMSDLNLKTLAGHCSNQAEFYQRHISDWRACAPKVLGISK